ncbi:F0F1 ATP synthase subunit delta [Salsuginibacillus kocurii]|uniref:F0F1 ATP synthase subunit delta n=1 Tax=Salsuginibacillus kocurii TaxID=427078 RepID=UPI0003697B03|nr:F0F1 ATP synthase subunit delta [Salsuginibacillus kocurii]
MSNSTIANRYAVALFDLAEEHNQIEERTAELQGVKQVFESTPELVEVLEHPNVTYARKEELLDSAFASCHYYIKNTLKLMLNQKRINLVVPMIEAFQTFSDEVRSVARADVYTVKPLSEQEKRLIEEKFAKRIGKQTMQVTNHIDPELIGGLRLRAGNLIFDGSVKGQLNRLERELTTGKR